VALKFGTAGDDSINGTTGDDTIWGDATGINSPPEIGADTIRGGDGIDIIRSFGGDDNHLVDRIDISTIDAIDGGSDNSFTYIGAAAFSVAGQVRAVQSGANTIIAINTAGASSAEMIFTLEDFTASTLTAKDFIM